MNAINRRLLVVIGVIAALALTACTPDGEVPPDKRTQAPTGPVLLTFSVYGPPQVITAYTKIAASFTNTHPQIVVNVRPYDTHAEALAADQKSRAAGKGPDIFMIEHSDLDALQSEKALRRVDDLLGERQVEFGDGFTRDALEDFSADSALQCMPTDVSPMVVYYNTGLINLASLATPGTSAVTPDAGWSFAEFSRAAHQASIRGRRGLYVEPSLDQVAPFVLSGGGKLVDDVADPTTLELSNGSSAKAMQQLLELVRDQSITFSQRQLNKSSALKRFLSGNLGMMLGYRGLTPVLRRQAGLTFDVMPMPKLKGSATIGRSSGACVSSQGEHLSATADFLAYLVSDESMGVLAETGYIQPTNVDVLNSPAFLQPTQRPYTASVFADQVRAIKRIPRSLAWEQVENRVSSPLTQLFYNPVIDPLETRLTAIDAASASLLAPPAPSASPSASPTQ